MLNAFDDVNMASMMLFIKNRIMDKCSHVTLSMIKGNLIV